MRPKYGKNPVTVLVLNTTSSGRLQSAKLFRVADEPATGSYLNTNFVLAWNCARAAWGLPIAHQCRNVRDPVSLEGLICHL